MDHSEFNEEEAKQFRDSYPKPIIDPDRKRDLEELFESDLEFTTGGYPKPTTAIQNEDLDEMFEEDLESIQAGYPHPELLDNNRSK